MAASSTVARYNLRSVVEDVRRSFRALNSPCRVNGMSTRESLWVPLRTGNGDGKWREYIAASSPPRSVISIACTIGGVVKVVISPSPSSTS